MDTDINNTKICPMCNAEYYAHIEKCKDCEVDLVSPITGTSESNTDYKEQDMGGLEGVELKFIDSGPTTRLKELYNVLSAAGIESSIVAGPPNMCSSDKALVVRAEQADRAMEVVTGHWKTVHPELAAALNNAEEGLCPACGAVIGKDETGADAKECHDCGLTLVIEDEG